MTISDTPRGVFAFKIFDLRYGEQSCSEGSSVGKRASDITELEHKLDDAVGERELNELAKEIAQRLHNKLRYAKTIGNTLEVEDLKKHVADFDKVITDIRARRRIGVLDDYDRYCAKERIDLH